MDPRPPTLRWLARSRQKPIGSIHVFVAGHSTRSDPSPSRRLNRHPASLRGVPRQPILGSIIGWTKVCLFRTGNEPAAQYRSSPDSPLEGAGFEPSVPRQESRRFEPASVPSRGGRCRRGGYGPGGDRRPDRAVEIADRRWCASEPPLESRIKPSRRVGPSRGTDGSNPSPSSGESRANLSSSISCRRRYAVGVAVADID